MFFYLKTLIKRNVLSLNMQSGWYWPTTHKSKDGAAHVENGRIRAIPGIH
jgi:hypothetical protein